MEFIKINVNLSRAKVTVANFGYPFGPFGLFASEDFFLNFHLSQAQVTLPTLAILLGPLACLFLKTLMFITFISLGHK